MLCPICAAPVRLSARSGFNAAPCGHSLLETADGVIVASRDLQATAQRAQNFIDRVETGAESTRRHQATGRVRDGIGAVSLRAGCSLDGAPVASQATA